MTEHATMPRPAAPPLTGRGGSATLYREIPEGTWRFEVGKPDLRQLWSEKYAKWSTLVDLPITLVESEKERLLEEYGPPPDGYQQSWRPAYGKYGCGYTLNPTSAGKESALVTFMASCFGAKNATEFRKWIQAGGCPIVDAPTNEGRIEQINSWLGWIEGAEVYMTIRHDPQPTGGVLARAGGPMAIGSLPGQPEVAYSATWKGKLRALIAQESVPTPAEQGVAEGAALAAAEFGDEPTYSATGEPIDKTASSACEHPADKPEKGCDACYQRIFGAPSAA